MTGGRRGFTLLEVLIAVLVLGLLILLLDQGFAFGVRAAATQQRAQARHGDLEAVDRTIRNMIGQADPGMLPQTAPFRGTASSLTWATVLPDAAASCVCAGRGGGT
jgi:general secretion pathway protein J